MGEWPQLPEVLPEGMKGVRPEFGVINAVVLEGLRVAKLFQPEITNSAIVIDTSEF